MNKVQKVLAYNYNNPVPNLDVSFLPRCTGLYFDYVVYGLKAKLTFTNIY